MSRQLDIGSANPRLQCAVCGQWKRIHKLDGGQTFYGGCNHSNGDHLAAKPDNADVCAECCDAACMAIKAKGAA